MFCDLVGSTARSQQLDAEEWRDLIAQYQQAASGAVVRFGGHVAKNLGDGLLIYFGWPTAREDDPERAVRAGLAIVEAVRASDERLHPNPPPFAEVLTGGGDRSLPTSAREWVPSSANTLRQSSGQASVSGGGSGRRPLLSVRVGMHTGPVVIADGGEVFGETANVAARVQGAAEPDTVVITAATQRLVAGMFVVEDRGPQMLKGVREPVTLYRVVQPSGVRSRLAVAAGHLTRFVGRDMELGTLVDRWERAQDGEGQNVVVLGEAGVGKSRLVYQLHEHLAAVPHTWLECGATPYTEGTPFHPVIALVAQGLAFAPEDTAAEQLGKLEVGLRTLASAETVALLGDFLGLPPPTPLQMSPELQRRKTIDLLAQWTLSMSTVQPLVVFVEDLHWCDASTLELLGCLIAQSPTARVLLLATARPEFTPPWPARSNLTTVQLARLTKRQVRDMIASVVSLDTRPEKTAATRDERIEAVDSQPNPVTPSSGPASGPRIEGLPDDVIDALVARADGVPLYVEELTKAVMEPGAARGVEAIPATLADSLMARLDRLSAAKESAREVAQQAAVLGREFGYPLLAATAGLDDAALRRGLARLVDAEILFARGEPPAATYTFKHALIQETAYGSLLRSHRAQLHGRIAACLEADFMEIVEAEPELLARHHAQAGNAKRAIEYCIQAGRRAQQRAAIREAIDHLRRGLDLVTLIEAAAERARAELDLQVALAPALQAAHGFGAPEAERCLARALELCGVLEATDEVFPVMWGYWFLHNAREDSSKARTLVQELFVLARDRDDPLYMLEAHHAAWGNPLGGNFTEQMEHTEKGLNIYDPARHGALALEYGGHDPGVCALYHRAVAQHALGFADQAQHSIEQAVALADNGPHLPTRLIVRHMTALLAFLRRSDSDLVLRITENAIEQSIEQGFPSLVPLSMGLGGWVKAVGHDRTEGLDEIAKAMDIAQSIGSGTLKAIQAEAVGRLRSPAEGVQLVDEALVLIERWDERLWEANAHTLKGELLLAQSDRFHEPAERCFRRAIEVARRQQARMWELRATTALARLWHSQGKTTAARDLLAPLYGWFTEGFDTPDLKDAQALLEESC